jgi:hypothetical protein
LSGTRERIEPFTSEVVAAYLAAIVRYILRMSKIFPRTPHVPYFW